MTASTLSTATPRPADRSARDLRSDRRLAERAGRELEDASAQEVVRWAVEEFGDALCVTSNMEHAVVSHLASQVKPGVDVVFLDTGYHFAETMGTRDAVAATMPVNLITVLPRRTVAEQDADHGPRLHDRAPDLCCRLRKVEPLREALAPYRAWMSGVRRDESPTRAGTPVVSWDARFKLVKVHPLARWTEADLHAYAEEHGVLVNPLVSEGYASIGCAPCTRAVAPGEDARAGRWPGRAKTECGLHS
jgi:phosphoadenosine phosphosulfate reductase